VLSDRDKQILDFAEVFEQQYVRQGRGEDRTIEDCLDLGWKLLATVDENILTRIDKETLETWHPKHRKSAAVTTKGTKKVEAEA
jgi:V/A-type H+-transporting ATPase subunit B